MLLLLQVPNLRGQYLQVTTAAAATHTATTVGHALAHFLEVMLLVLLLHEGQLLLLLLLVIATIAGRQRRRQGGRDDQRRGRRSG